MELQLSQTRNGIPLLTGKSGMKKNFFTCEIYNPFYFPVNVTYRYTHFWSGQLKEETSNIILEPFECSGFQTTNEETAAKIDDMICEALSAERVPFECLDRK